MITKLICLDECEYVVGMDGVKRISQMHHPNGEPFCFVSYENGTGVSVYDVKRVFISEG